MHITLCIFCGIINRKIAAKIIDEDEYTLVIQDINPKAPIHYLIIPKKHVESLCSMQKNELQLMNHTMRMAHQLAQQLSEPRSCRLIMNNGKNAGQSVFHAHVHFLSGKQFIDF